MLSRGCLWIRFRNRDNIVHIKSNTILFLKVNNIMYEEGKLKSLVKFKSCTNLIVFHHVIKEHTMSFYNIITPLDCVL